MDAVTALDALVLIDHANAVVIIGDGADRASLLARTNKMGNRAVRTCLRAHTALFALIGINVGSSLANADRTELTGIDTCLAHAETAVISYGIGGKRTFLTGRADYLNNVLRLGDSIRALSQGKIDSLFDELSLFVDTAAIGCHGSGNDLIDEFFPVFLIQLAVPGQLGCLFHNSVLQSHECSIIGYHLLLLSAMRLQFLILGCVHDRQIVVSILCKNHDTFLTILYCTKSEGIFIELL